MKAFAALLPRLLVLLFALAWLLPASAGEVIPPAPQKYFNDHAGLVPAGTASVLNAQLELHERETSNQLVVAIYPSMQSNSSVEDYTVRVARAWKVGQEGRNNGAVLFIFVKEHQAYIQVGYGLEARLTDVRCKRIIEDQLVPYFKAGNYSEGLRSAVTSLISAAKGEYSGTGKTHAEKVLSIGKLPTPLLLGILGVMVFILMLVRWIVRRPYVYTQRRSYYDDPWFGSSSSSSSSSSGWFDNDNSSGGGWFSGGGGDFGGGGAGGKW